MRISLLLSNVMRTEPVIDYTSERAPIVGEFVRTAHGKSYRVRAVRHEMHLLLDEYVQTSATVIVTEAANMQFELAAQVNLSDHPT